MKRKITERRRQRVRAYDVRRDLTKETLAGIGAMALAWNDVEAMLDILLCVCMDIPTSVWREMTTRINGIDGKIGLIKSSLLNVLRLSEDFTKFTEDTLGAVAQFRGYRDTIIHSRVIDVGSEIAEMTFRRGKIEEVLITVDALNELYDSISALHKEIMELISVVESIYTWGAVGFEDVKSKGHAAMMFKRYSARLAAMDEGKPGAIATDSLTFALGQDTQSAAQELQGAMSRYQHYQHQRKSLPPLPSFPPESSVPKQTAEKQEGQAQKHKASGPQPSPRRPVHRNG